MRAVRTLLPVLLVVVTACKKSGGDATQASKAPAAPPVKVATFIATEALTPEVLTLTGTVTADQRSEVTADIQGKVISVMVERGQRVKMGAAVVQLDVRNASLSAREAQANLEGARAQRALAESECARAKALLDKGAITRSEFDRQNTECTATLQQVNAAEARTAMISKSVSDGLVRAPFDGMIAEKSVSPGEWVAPGRALFTLVKDDPLRIELSVPEVAVGAIQKGEIVKLSAVARPGFEWSASVTRIGAEIGRTRALIVEATIDPKSMVPITSLEAMQAAAAQQTPPTAGSGSGSAATPKPADPPQPTNEAQLVPGMFAEARVMIGQHLHPVLPQTAVAKRGKTWHAFVSIKGELEDRIVQIGPTPAPGKVSILLGINAGDKVVETVTEQTVDGLKVVE